MKRMIARGLTLAILAIVASGLLSLAGGRPPEVFAAYNRAMGLRQVTGGPWIDDDPCVLLEVARDGNDAYLIASGTWDRACIGAHRSEVMHGVWYDGFEERGFVPNVESVPSYRVISMDSGNPEFDTELDMDADEARRRLGIRPEDYRASRGGTLAIAITFVGRRTTPHRTDSGHLFQMIIVDAVLSGRVLGPVTTRIEMPGCEGECAEPR